MTWISIKKCVQNIAWYLSPKISCFISYYHNRGKIPNFRNPTDLSEIVFSQMINGTIKKYANYVDKIKVRDYIVEWGLGDYLPELYAVWNNACDMNLEQLPNEFALKTNNYCGGHLFCRDKKDFDLAIAKEHMDKQLKAVSNGVREIQYSCIKPQIFAEELIVDPIYQQPMDYKIHCCDGKVKGCLLVSGRGEESGFKLSFYDTDWNCHPEFLRGKEKSDRQFSKPENYEIMLSVAKKIASNFEQVRVDLYNVNGKIYIGELTFTPEGGMMSYYTNEALSYLGREK